MSRTDGAAEIGGEAWAVDLSDTAALEGLRLECDVLVNNAGIQRVAPIHEFVPEDFRLIQRLMLEAPFLLIRAALPHMYAGGWGRIINVSSAHGLHGIPEDEVVEKIMLTRSAVKRMGEPDEVAALAAFLVSDDAGMVTGTSLTMDGAWTAQ
ncbi:SDR family oxidoreductase [Ornithinimicrobium ciconiae]|uniref:SDR family oxidoreductase n=1 Tax=Ornithinimicrobium ciconiae TaxID=2594265 RepID=UPI001D18CE29|nr:SDR family oxidoreductase [Ornithinimicrobium ciconiae]